MHARSIRGGVNVFVQRDSRESPVHPARVRGVAQARSQGKDCRQPARSEEHGRRNGTVAQHSVVHAPAERERERVGFGTTPAVEASSEPF